MVAGHRGLGDIASCQPLSQDQSDYPNQRDDHQMAAWVYLPTGGGGRPPRGGTTKKTCRAFVCIAIAIASLMTLHNIGVHTNDEGGHYSRALFSASSPFGWNTSSQPNERTPKIAIFSIFLGQYIHFLPGFLENMRAFFLPDRERVFYIISDEGGCAQLRSLPDVECVVKKKLGWPYETLYRWNYFKTSFNPSPSTTSHIFFFNANALCKEIINGDDILAPYTAVIHQGYYDKPHSEFTFELNPLSTAYLPPAPHHKYYGGRFLGATTENFIKLCDILDRNTQIDESNHYIAEWHDESHWNHYVNTVLEGEIKEVGPEYHVPEEWTGTLNIPTKIIYLDKRIHIPNFSLSKSALPAEVIHGEIKKNNPYRSFPVFLAYNYRQLNPDLQSINMTDDQLRLHYLDNLDRPYLYETEAFAAHFDVAKYKLARSSLLSDMEAKYHYIRYSALSGNRLDFYK